MFIVMYRAAGLKEDKGENRYPSVHLICVTVTVLTTRISYVILNIEESQIKTRKSVHFHTCSVL